MEKNMRWEEKLFFKDFAFAKPLHSPALHSPEKLRIRLQKYCILPINFAFARKCTFPQETLHSLAFPQEIPRKSIVFAFPFKSIAFPHKTLHLLAT